MTPEATRRSILNGLSSCLIGLVALSSVTHEVEASPPPPTHATRYIMPTPRGKADGTSWENAATLKALDAMVSAVGAGGTVYLRSDDGDYLLDDSAVLVAHGGNGDRPVTIIGVDGSLTPTKAVIVGNRTEWSLPDNPEQVTSVSDWRVGQVVFELADGADSLAFKFIDFRHTGHPFHLTAPTHMNITVEDCSGYNFRRFFEHDPGTSHIGTIIRRVRGIGFSKTAIRIRGNSHDVLLEDAFLDSGRQDGDCWATGVELNETAHDVVMIRVVARNCYWSNWNRPDTWWNADGFSSERGNYNITRRNCIASGNTDAGFDDKGEHITNINCIAYENTVNYKFWGSSHINENCVSLNPVRHGSGSIQHYWLSGDWTGFEYPGIAGHLIIRGGLIKDDNPETYVLVTEGSNAQIHVVDAIIETSPDATKEYAFRGTGSAFLYGSVLDSGERRRSRDEEACCPETQPALRP